MVQSMFRYLVKALLVSDRQADFAIRNATLHYKNLDHGGVCVCLVHSVLAMFMHFDH